MYQPETRPEPVKKGGVLDPNIPNLPTWKSSIPELRRLSGFVAPSSAQKLDSMELVAGSSTPAPGPNALPFGTPVATGDAQVLCFGDSPLARSTALPAPAAAGAEKKDDIR